MQARYSKYLEDLVAEVDECEALSTNLTMVEDVLKTADALLNDYKSSRDIIVEHSNILGTYNQSFGNRMNDDIRKLKKNRRKLADVLGKLKAYRLANLWPTDC